jgi:hypothetical protein
VERLGALHGEARVRLGVPGIHLPPHDRAQPSRAAPDISSMDT